MRDDADLVAESIDPSPVADPTDTKKKVGTGAGAGDQVKLAP